MKIMYILVPPAPKIGPNGMEGFQLISPTGIDFGVVSENGTPILEGFHFRSGRQFTDEQGLIKNFIGLEVEEHLAGNWFYGGILFAHFGHFLTESVHRIIDFQSVADKFDGIIFQKAPHRGNTGYDPLNYSYIYDVLFKYFKLSVSQIRFAEKAVSVEKLFFSPQRHQLGTSPQASYLDKLEQLEADFLKSHKTSQNRRSADIFLSRRSYLSSGRALGMRSIEEIFEENGFTVAYPEEKTLAEQVAALRSAKNVIVEAGSAIHLLDILGRQDFRLSIFSRRGRDASYWRGMYGNRVSALEIFDDVMPIHNYTGHLPGSGHSLLNPTTLVAFLRKLGLQFDEKDFLRNLRGETFNDMRKLKICLPGN